MGLGFGNSVDSYLVSFGTGPDPRLVKRPKHLRDQMVFLNHPQCNRTAEGQEKARGLVGLFLLACAVGFSLGEVAELELVRGTQLVAVSGCSRITLRDGTSSTSTTAGSTLLSAMRAASSFVSGAGSGPVTRTNT